MDRLEKISTQLPEPSHAGAVADSMSVAGDTIAGLAQSDLVGSLTTLVDNLSVVVKIGDEIAKVYMRLSFFLATCSDHPADTPMGEPCLERSVCWT